MALVIFKTTILPLAGIPFIGNYLVDIGFQIAIFVGSIFTTLRIIRMNGEFFIETPINYH